MRFLILLIAIPYLLYAKKTKEIEIFFGTSFEQDSIIVEYSSSIYHKRKVVYVDVIETEFSSALAGSCKFERFEGWDNIIITVKEMNKKYPQCNDKIVFSFYLHEKHNYYHFNFNCKLLEIKSSKEPFMFF